MNAAKRPLRVVIDTNVVLSALVFGGSRFDTLRFAVASRL
jgi:predicted nucleic acid-binding protein